MNVQVISYTPMKVAERAICKCYDTEVKTDRCNVGLIDRVAVKHKHESTMEHLVYSFDIDGVSRALLQELARHGREHLSVKSSRYTLQELKDEEPFLTEADEIRAYKYCVIPDFGSPEPLDMLIAEGTVRSLEILRVAISKGVKRDKAKYLMPESYRTSFVFTLNARFLKNFIKLRTHKTALWEIRELAYKMYKQLPEDHKFLYEEAVYKEKENAN